MVDELTPSQTRRIALQSLLESLLGTDQVYYQEPPNIGMRYPCILYKRDSEDSQHADNKPYSRRRRYEVTVMDTNPDSEIPEKIADLSSSSFDRHFRADNLNHFVYHLFF